MKAEAKERIVIISVAILIVITLISIPIYNIKKYPNLKEDTIQTNNNHVSSNGIEEFAFINNINIDNISKYRINKKYTNLSFTKENNFINQIIVTKTKSVANINDIIKSDMQDKFYTLINYEIEVKYPMFIASALKDENTTKSYEFADDGITIHFSNYETTPIYSKPTSVKLTCSMIKDYVDFDCKDNSVEIDPNIQELDPNKKTIAITFDDGPNKNTSSILETLKDNHMNATFFEVGKNINLYPETVKKLVSYGNEVGSHSYDHKMLTKCSDEELSFEIDETNNIFKNITGEDIKLLRPPYGSINEELKNNLNYSFILWSVDTEDWKYRDTKRITEYTLETIEDGDIVLFHDIHYTTAEAMKLILPELYIRDYQVVTVSNLAKLKKQNLEANKIYRHFK